jgi:hypothetical protein
VLSCLFVHPRGICTAFFAGFPNSGPGGRGELGQAERQQALQQFEQFGTVTYFRTPEEGLTLLLPDSWFCGFWWRRLSGLGQFGQFGTVTYFRTHEAGFTLLLHDSWFCGFWWYRLSGLSLHSPLGRPKGLERLCHHGPSIHLS